MDALSWIRDKKTIEKSKRPYAHFDERTDIEKMSDYILEPENIVRHSFYPFIHYTMHMNKFSKKKGKVEKKREIYYAAHSDRCIYQYYSFMLNESYSDYVKKAGINDVAVAYRSNLGESNITSSKRAFDFIRETGDCYVMIGDFTSFFDCLDHKYLKEKIKEILGVQMLAADYYAVYKNVTKFAYVERDKLFELNGLGKTKSDLRKLNNKNVVLSKRLFRENRSEIVHKNHDNKGVPQGSPISAVMANIYMVSGDKMIHDYVNSIGGLYIRYSDDFIVVIPHKEEYKEHFSQVLSCLKKIPNLELEPSKTQIFEVKEGRVSNIGKTVLKDADDSKKEINFLGFTYDGQKVRLRAKTIGKYYYRMNRKAKAIANNGGVGIDKLYMKYSDRGAYGKEGNFFTYVNNAEKAYGDNELIRRDLKHHMDKIRKSIKKNQKQSEDNYTE